MSDEMMDDAAFLRYGPLRKPAGRIKGRHGMECPECDHPWTMHVPNVDGEGMGGCDHKSCLCTRLPSRAVAPTALVAAAEMDECGVGPEGLARQAARIACELIAGNPTLLTSDAIDAIVDAAVARAIAAAAKGGAS